MQKLKIQDLPPTTPDPAGDDKDQEDPNNKKEKEGEKEPEESMD